jgi:hypothetical protein
MRVGIHAKIVNMAHLLSGPPYLEPLAVEGLQNISLLTMKTF